VRQNLRKGLFEPEIKNHHGHIFKLIGDALLSPFTKRTSVKTIGAHQFSGDITSCPAIGTTDHHGRRTVVVSGNASWGMAARPHVSPAAPSADHPVRKERRL